MPYLLHMLLVFVVVCCTGCSTTPHSSPAASGSLKGSSAGVTGEADGRRVKGWQRPYEVMGKSYTPLLSHEGFVQQGVASWYGKKFHGRKTSNGEIYDMYAMTAAHKTLPLGVFVRVENQNNDRVAVVRVNDRGPFVAGRIIDLSYSAAKKLGVVGPGTAPVKITALGYQETRSDGMVRYTLPESIQNGPFSVQIGAFTQPQNAQRLRTRMQIVYGHAIVSEAVVNGQTYFRVKVGHYTSLDDANIALAEMEELGYGRGFVVALD